jgi:spermidine synthase
MSQWYEFFRKDAEKLSYLITGHVLTSDTPFQKVEILETATFGRALFLDGSLQSTQVDEFSYHEALVHPALCRIANPSSVFIAGGGEGALAREVLKHPSVERVIMADIDAELVRIARDYLPEWHAGAFEDPRLEVIFDDAFGSLERAKGPFDAVIVDVTAPKPENPGVFMYTREFFELARSKLTPNGLFVSQAQSTNVNNLSFFASIHATLKEVFAVVRPFQANLASDGDCWGYMMAGSGNFDAGDVDATLALRNIHNLKLYDSEADRHMFALPRYVRSALAKPGAHISTRASPFRYGPVD